MINHLIYLCTEEVRNFASHILFKVKLETLSMMMPLIMIMLMIMLPPQSIKCIQHVGFKEHLACLK